MAMHPFYYYDFLIALRAKNGGKGSGKIKFEAKGTKGLLNTSKKSYFLELVFREELIQGDLQKGRLIENIAKSRPKAWTSKT